MNLNTDRLHIRRIVKDDWRDVLEIWRDFAQSQYAQFDMPHDTDEESACRRIAKWAQFGQSMEHIFFAVCLDGRVIGYIAFNIRSDGYEIGYCFHSRHHGKGYARESLSALLEYMRSLGARRFSAGTALLNLPSVKLLKSRGFEQVGEEKVSFYQDAQGNDVFFDGGIFVLGQSAGIGGKHADTGN